LFGEKPNKKELNLRRGGRIPGAGGEKRQLSLFISTRERLQRKALRRTLRMFVGRGGDRRKPPQPYKHSKGQAGL